MKMSLRQALAVACALVLASGGAFAATQDNGKSGSDATNSRSDNATSSGNDSNASKSGKDAQDASELVNRSAQVLQQMERSPGMQEALANAQGVFIVPKYGRGALGVGARGGKGVLLVNQDGKWSEPAFYRLGGVSLGLQAGAEAGSIALVLNNEKALNSFKQKNNWSLNADAGLTVVNWSRRAQASAGKGDVIAWTNTKGLMGDLAVSLTDINFDQNKTSAFYGKQVALDDVLNGSATPPSKRMAALRKLHTASAGNKSSGSSSGSDESTSGK